jgi:hypothetical protein
VSGRAGHLDRRERCHGLAAVGRFHVAETQATSRTRPSAAGSSARPRFSWASPSWSVGHRTRRRCRRGRPGSDWSSRQRSSLLRCRRSGPAPRLAGDPLSSILTQACVRCSCSRTAREGAAKPTRSHITTNGNIPLPRPRRSTIHRHGGGPGPAAHPEHQRNIVGWSPWVLSYIRLP